MLSARAYSMKQKSRLAISLSWIGGYTNVIALLALGSVVSHVSGTMTQLGRSLGSQDTAQAMFFGGLLASFLAGAVLSALMTETAKRRGWRSKYILPIALEAVLLIVVAQWIPHDGMSVRYAAPFACMVASFAMGLQNATITKISGAVVRTTHLTGIFTDLGLEGVQYMFWYKDRLMSRRWERAGRLLRVSFRHPSAQRLALLASIATSFGLGSVLGCVAYAHWTAWSLYFPVCFLLVIVYMDIHRPIADIKDIDLLNDPELRLQGIISKLLPREIGLYRFACTQGNRSHRAPNFQLWVSRVPEHCRVVILAISSFTRFDANAILDLEAAVKLLHTRGRKLILSGITTVQFRALDNLGVAKMMDVSNLCPDLEFAIVRAMVLLEYGKRSERDSADEFYAAIAAA